MNDTTIRPTGNLVPTDWAIQAVETVRDRLYSLDPDALISMRDALATTLSEAIGGLTYKPEPAPSLAPESPDFEDLADLEIGDDGTMYLDFSRSEDYPAMEALASDFNLELDDTRLCLGHCDDVNLPSPCLGFMDRWLRLARRWESGEADRRSELLPRGGW